MSLEDIERAISNIRTTQIVTCPRMPAVIVGSDSATALESGDTIGEVFKIKVPKSGIIISATLFDFDDEGTQVDVEIFSAKIADVAVDAAYAPTDAEGLTFITKLGFVSFDDQGSFQTSELPNIGKAYSVPNGVFFIQAVTRATPTIAAGVPHRLQLQILSKDSTFKET